MSNKEKINEVLEETEELKKQAETEETKMQEKAEETIVQEETEETSGRYQKITKLDENLWTYGSPILIENGVLERDQISQKNRLTLKFTNIYEQTIRDVYLKIFAEDAEGKVEKIEHSYMALGQAYLKAKGGAAKIPVKNEEAKSFKVKIDKVVFEDGSVWEKEDSYLESAGSMESVESFAQAKTKEYEDNYLSATEAVSKDESSEISNGIDIFKRISWYKDSKEKIRDAKRKYGITKQNEERRQASQNRRDSRKKAVRKKYVVTGVVILVLLALAGVSTVAFFIPNKKYKSAKKLLKSEQYEKAAQSFENLHGFLKSEEYLAQAYYNLGLKALADGDEKGAKEYFNKSFDADDESQYGLMAGAFLDYYKGEEALANKDYDKAYDLFQASADAASDFNLINKASVGMAEISYNKQNYETAWNTIKNVFAKDSSYSEQFGEYGYGYAKLLVDKGEIKKGMEIYNEVSKYSKSADLNKSVYNQAVKLGEAGKISESLKLLEQIKDGYSKGEKLYNHMSAFDTKVKLWLGTWTHKGTVKGEKVTYTITISELLYKGEMCLSIKDMNNKYLGFDTVISSKNHVTQIEIGEYMLHFKLKKYHDQKFTFTMLEGRKMLRELKYADEKFSTKYKKKAK